MSWAHRFIMCHGQDQGSVKHVNYEEQDQEGSDQVFCCLQIGPLPHGYTALTWSP